MNLSQLYYFQKLAEIQHYSTAAKELHISQPALSSAISSLESELFVPLFQKCGRNVKLTDYGKEFYEYVSKSLRLIEQGSAVMKEYSNQISGTVKIGCIPTLLNEYLPNIIRNYQGRYENAHFDIYHGMSKEIIAGVQNRTYDIGFCSKMENTPDLVYVPVYYQEIIAICRKDNDSVQGESIPLSYLKNQKEIFTYRDTIPIGKLIKSILKKHNIEANYRFDDEITLGGVVTNFDKFVICADTPFLSQFTEIKKLHISDLPPETRLIYMCYNKSTLQTAIIESFMNYVVTNELKLPE